MEENSDDLLDQWLNLSEPEQAADESNKEQIPRAPQASYYPLSIAQQRLWFVYQKNPESPVYNYSEVWKFQEGAFHLETFTKALDRLVEKHRVLASNYIILEEEAVMVFRDENSFSLQVHDQEFSVEEARQKQKELASKAFRLESDPLIRIGIFPLENGEYSIGITFHHIIIDAWSIGILRSDFAAFYKELNGKEESQKIELRNTELQYSDYSHWLKEQPKDIALVNPSQDFMDSFLELPLDYARPARPSYRGQLLRFSLPKSLTPKIGGLLKTFQTTDFNLFLAAFQVLLGRYGKSKNVNVGIPVLNRDREEFKSMVGYFVDTQVIAAELNDSKKFDELIAEVKTDVLKAISSQKPSYEQLLLASKASKDQSYNPIFQAMFVGHSSGENPFQELGIPVDFEVLDLDVSKFDLTLHHFGLKDGAYQIGIEFSQDLFSTVFADRMNRHFATLLKEICDHPDLPIHAYSLISEEERSFLTSGLSPDFHPENEGTVLTAILDNLQNKRDQVAVVCGSERLTYGELGHRSAIISKELEKLNLDPELPIGIYMERSVDFLVSLLAIMKFGGAYLPLDPEYPDDRIIHYLAESGAKYVLTHRGLLASKTSIKESIHSLEIDSLDYNQNTVNQIDKNISENRNAYLIFTSGSTNKPKGVYVNHQNLYSSVAARKAYYQESPEAFLLLSSFSFDSSVAGIFWSLCTGGKLVISQANETLDSTALSTLISREKVSHTLMLPSLYQALMQGSENSWDSLKIVILAGEEFPNELISSHFEKQPKTRLFNEYGPTEGTVWCTVQELKAGESFHKVPIGLATSNALGYVLDEQQKLSPVGISGELCIAGAGLTKGYLSKSETDEKFLKNPYSEVWDRIYRTGDLVRIQKDGLIEYLGRTDNQVKIRGHRIELGEIQELALQFPTVQTAVALVSTAKEPQLILAYSTSAGLEESELSRFLRQKLPNYMVPEIFVALDDWPRLPNGKVDLASIQELAQSQPKAAESAFRGPSTYLERQVAGIWADVMGVEEVPVNRDFNDLGGNSLQSIRIISRCRNIGIKVTPAQFLRYSTVESLVKSLHHEEYARPENLLELEILKVWEKYLGQKLIGVKDSIQKNGGAEYEWKLVEKELNDSYEFQKPIQLTDSIQDISKKIVIKKELVESLSKPIKRIIPVKTTGDKLPVFCIHSEFYYETVYSQLTRHLPAEYPVYGVLSVSPELVKDSVPRSIEEIAALCLEEIKLIQKNGPYRILSYSIGNVVAFELAKRLMQEGEKVNLVMIDPPLFFDKSRVFGKGGYRKLFKYLDYWNKPSVLISKLIKKVKKDKNQPVLIRDTGLLKKYLLSYKPEKIDCETLLITTPREFKHAFGWEPLVKIVDHEEILGPHLKLMREPYTGQMNAAIARNLEKWDQIR
ncbi:amino acid adenylation domain-containing protein [Algoriphagus halophytocola]|uniref:non-ribosomal peptide synthetase n=1 Tax=Algoriphagus halophytocola TaxID=2991499 RepID=UPI0022DE8368|nr:amino acid adenylation domain-containing protein [Algoriphagus sp. TR-M9]WBL44771.1 amino acid adenylation domain-containing protein [Algoriphagus sp. TR-M9]